MKQARPTIGITGPDRGGMAAWLFSALAVRLSGGRPLRIRPGKPRGISAVDGLVIGGGADVDPALYGAKALSRPRTLHDHRQRGWQRILGIVLFPLVLIVRRLLMTKHGGLNPARDAMEKQLITQALERGLPLMGICRGMQLLNVVNGGTLHQDLQGFYEEHPEIRSVLPRKRIHVEPGSLLGKVLGLSSVRVNALHSQAIDQPGAGLIACAREPNGVIQAIESQGPGFALGVQWHPEYLPQRSDQRALFKALVSAAREKPQA
jgi:putative glutamine amidotransferase